MRGSRDRSGEKATEDFESLKKAKIWERCEDADLGGVLAEELDGADAIGVESVVDVVGEVVADGFGQEREAGRPLVDEIFDVCEAVIAGECEVVDELRGSEVRDGE